MKVDFIKVLELLNAKFELAKERQNVEIMTMITDLKNDVIGLYNADYKLKN